MEETAAGRHSETHGESQYTSPKDTPRADKELAGFYSQLYGGRTLLSVRESLISEPRAD